MTNEILSHDLKYIGAPGGDYIYNEFVLGETQEILYKNGNLFESIEDFIHTIPPRYGKLNLFGVCGTMVLQQVDSYFRFILGSNNEIKVDISTSFIKLNGNNYEILLQHNPYFDDTTIAHMYTNVYPITSGILLLFYGTDLIAKFVPYLNE